MRGNIAQLMQQAQKMQENLQKAQEEIAKIEVTGSAGGGMVSVTLTGAKECRKVRIDPSLTSDPEMLEDLIAAAFNDALEQDRCRVEVEDGVGHRRHAAAAGHEAAVLISQGAPAAAGARSNPRSSMARLYRQLSSVLDAMKACRRVRTPA